MSDLIQIEECVRNPEIWRVLLITIGILGIYLSLMVLGSSRGKPEQHLYLGIYIASLSILLFHLICLIDPVDRISGVAEALGRFSLFLIGPVSYRINCVAGKRDQRLGFILHLIPAAAILIIILVSQPKSTAIYIAGLIHIGIYLIWQIVKIRSREKKILQSHPGSLAQDNRRSRVFIIIQMILYIGIGSVVIAGEWVLIFLFSLASLSLLILLIWIWLLYTAYLSYLNNIQ